MLLMERYLNGQGRKSLTVSPQAVAHSLIYWRPSKTLATGPFWCFSSRQQESRPHTLSLTS